MQTRALASRAGAAEERTWPSGCDPIQAHAHVMTPTSAPVKH